MSARLAATVLDTSRQKGGSPVKSATEKSSQTAALPSELFTNDEAAKFLKKTTKTLQRMRQAGRLGFFVVCGRPMYSREQLAEYLSSVEMRKRA